MQPIAGYTDHVIHQPGIELHYLEWGSPDAPVMVLLHGLTGHAHTWDHMAPRLAERYRVLALDQRGHGDSAPGGSYATREFVADLEAVVEALHVERFVLMGLSMGGHNAMAYAAAHPARVERLIVIDIPPRMERTNAPNWNMISRLAETGHKRYAGVDEAVIDARAGNPTAPEENLRYRTEWNLRTVDDGSLQLKYDPKAPAAWQPEDLWPSIASIAAPTLIVRGGKTPVLARDTAERMAATFPHAELVEVPDSGHSVPTDAPAALTDVVLDWLSRQPQSESLSRATTR